MGGEAGRVAGELVILPSGENGEHDPFGGPGWVREKIFMRVPGQRVVAGEIASRAG